MQTKSWFQLAFSGLMALIIAFAAIGPAGTVVSAAGNSPLTGYDPASGDLIFVGSEAGQALDVAGVNNNGIASSANALAIIKAYAPRLGLDSVENLTVMRETQTDNRRYYHFQQLAQGSVPVYGGEILVSTNDRGQLLSLSSKLSKGMWSMALNPGLNAKDAQASGLKLLAEVYGKNSKLFSASEAELWVFDERIFLPESTRKPELVWKMEISALKSDLPIRDLVMVNALTGAISLRYSLIDSALSVDVYDMNGSTNQGALPGTFVCNETTPLCTSGIDTDADRAMEYGIDTYNFYSSYHGRDSIDNAGMSIVQSVHFGVGYQNAFWNGAQMVYGDGFSAADDVVGHELTHGVTEHESNLFYAYQSGAINESFSDVWGEFVDLTNASGDDSAGVRWLMGEDIPGIGAIRDMSFPTDFGDPDRITSPYYFTGSGDSGGVHYNSGVNNKAVYLMTDGDTFNGYTVTGLGIDKVSDIYYEAQTNLLTRATTFLDLYYALNQACTNLIGGSAGITSGDCTEVNEALLAVEMSTPPSPASINPVAVPGMCPLGKTAQPALFSDDFESGIGQWRRGVTSTRYRKQAWGWAAGGLTDGTGYALRAKDYGVNSDSFIATPYITLPASTYMFFKHAYFVEKGYDGGMLEYTVNGYTWISLKSKIAAGQKQNVKLNNAILGAGTYYGFSGPSMGVTGSMVNLSSLSGQRIKIRLRMTSDYSYGADGWFIDDFSIHVCQ
jgi:Zn-dependent metalloprotease